MDGEGCIRYDGASEQVSVTSCYPHHLNEIKQEFGFGYVREIRGNSIDRTCYRLEFHGRKARSFIAPLMPHLREKNYQGQLLMNLRTVPKNTASHAYLVNALKTMKKVDYALRTQRAR